VLESSRRVSVRHCFVSFRIA